MTIRSDGRVGIGTGISPASRFHVRGTQAEIFLDQFESGSGTNPNLRISNFAPGGRSWGLISSHAVVSVESFTVFDYTAGPGRLTINSSGNTGLGRTSTAHRLEVEGNASKTTAGDWLANSDARLKTDIRSVDNALETIRRLRPVKFRYNDTFIKLHPSVTDRYYYNFIAQEFREVFPESVQDDGEGYLQVDTYNVRPFLVSAVQELDAGLEELKSENAQLRRSNRALKAQLNNLVSIVQRLEQLVTGKMPKEAEKFVTSD